MFFTLNREDFSFVIHLDRQPRTSRRREAQTGSRARSGSRSERTLDAVEHSRTLMEWWPFLIFHRGGLRIKVINNKRLIAESCRKQDIEPDQLTLHADRGSSMRSKPVGLLLADLGVALLHGPEQIADLPVPVAESPGAVRIGHPERSHLVEYLAPNSVFNSLPRQRSSPHLRPDDRLVTIDRVLHHASLGVA